uniref:Uncharacterized protein n=1 Tax=Rhizophora mucronata TaxID=61149 RepID=A0A2P2J0C0_RHIMU
MQACQSPAQHWKLFSLFNSPIVQPWSPPNSRGREVNLQSGSHLKLELALELFGIRHDGLRILLLLLHVHVHVPHSHFVVQARHPAVRVLPNGVM